MPINPRAKIVDRKGPWIVASMRRFWTKKQLDKHSAEPTIHQTFEEAFTEASKMTLERKRGHFAVFECVGFIRLGKPPRKKISGD